MCYDKIYFKVFLQENNRILIGSPVFVEAVVQPEERLDDNIFQFEIFSKDILDFVNSVEVPSL